MGALLSGTVLALAPALVPYRRLTLAVPHYSSSDRSGKTTFVQVTYTARAYWGRARGHLWRAEGQGEREVSPGSWRVPALGFQELASNSSSFLGEAFSDASLGVLSLSSVHPQCILGTTYRVVLELSYR